MNVQAGNRCVVFGAGGHGAVVVDALLESGLGVVVGILDPNSELWGRDILGVFVVGGDDRLEDMVKSGANAFVVGVGSIGNVDSRRRLFTLGQSAGLRPLSVLHPSAFVSNYAKIGEGVVIGPNAVVHTLAAVGANAIVNSAAVVEHDCRIGAHAHIATGAKLAGGVRVGDGAHIGAGAVIREGVEIGANALVGIGAAVIDDVAANDVVGGVPAVPLRHHQGDGGEGESS